MGYTPEQLQSMGATPGASQGQASPQDLYNSFDGSFANETSPQQGIVQKFGGGAVNYAKGVGQQYMQGAQNIESDISEAGQGKQSPISAGVQTAGEVAKATFAPVTQALSPVISGTFNKLNSVADVLSGKPQGYTAQQNSQASQAIQNKLVAHPELAKNVDALANVLLAVGGEGAADETGANPNIEDIPGKVADTANKTIETVKNALPETKTTTPEDTTTSRIQDATPDYNPKMVGENVTTPEGKTIPRVNEGKGFFGDRTVNTSKSETENGKELTNIKDYPDKGTFLEKTQAVHKAISDEAENMRGALQEEDKTNPLDAQAEKNKVESLVKNNLPKEIQDKIGYISKDNQLSKLGIKDNPQTPLNKALQEMSASPEDSLPKTAAGRYYQKVLDELKSYDGSREGKLDLRQAIDNAYKNARGKLAFGSDSQNALDETNTDIRDSINKDLKASTKNTDTQASLDKQTKLYRAKDVLDNKAEKEDTSGFKRWLQQHPTTRFVGRMLARRAVSIPLSVGATAAGIYEIGKHSK